MEVKKLYYEDSHLQTFTANVTACTEVKGGWAVTLDATAFYPEGGGQPCDLGVLGEANVLDVREQDGDIVHLCDRALAVGSSVNGRIDWDRRQDLIQQHSGEHMVSGVIHRRYGWHNVGFHIGADLVTIDFDGPIPAEDLPKIEDRVNAAIWENLSVKCYYPAPEELPKVNYRRKKDLPWPVRIVEFPGIDICACCGTQVKQTGEIGLVKLFSCVKFHEGVRIEMVCGKRALALLGRVYDQNKLVSQAFSAKIQETGEAARKMNELMAAQKYRITGLEMKIFEGIARGYTGAGDVLHFEEGLDNNAVRELADKIAERCGGTAAVFSGDEDAGFAFCLVARQGDLRQLGKDMTKALNGRGGGKPNCQQGRVGCKRTDIETFFAK